MPELSRLFILIVHNDTHYNTLIISQNDANMDKDSHKTSLFLATGSIVVVQREDSHLWTGGHYDEIWIKRPQRQTLQDLGNQNETHYYQNTGTCEAPHVGIL